MWHTFVKGKLTRVTSLEKIHAERNIFAQTEPDEREKTEGNAVPRKER